MRKLFFIPALLLMFTVCSCVNKVEPESGKDEPQEKKEEPSQEKKDEFGIELSPLKDVMKGQTVVLVCSGTSHVKAGDMLYLKGASTFVMPVEILSDTSFSVSIPLYLVDGGYAVSILQGGRTINVGDVKIEVSDNPDMITPDVSSTVYGRITCGSDPVQGVVVSDGIQVVRTDGNGVYQFPSEKKHGYVFISTPSGYRVESKGVVPQFFKYTASPASQAERMDFSLVKDVDQTSHTALFMGDFQVCGINDDVNQMQQFIGEMNDYAAANSGKKFFGMTLGDMSWDTYWVSNKFGLPEYLEQMNKIKGMDVYQTIGNHDYEFEAAGDFDTSVKYKTTIGPTYYSFNVGRIHYISLDNIVCKNNGQGTRSYDKYVDDEQLAWLEKDLSYVDKNTQIVVSMHVNLSGFTKNKDLLLAKFAGFSKPVHFFTAHTHTMTNSDKTSSSTPYYEHNAATVSGALWVTGHYTPGQNVCADGTPGGYTVMEVSGEDIKWRYKAVGRSDDYQFRTYDRQVISLTGDNTIAGASSTNKTNFEKNTANWTEYGTSNKLFLNIWNYDSSWTVEVFEDGKSLAVTSSSKTDPYFILIYPAKYYNSASTQSGLGNVTKSTDHFFSVSAASPTSTLEVKVTDRFGRVYTETVKRPKYLSEENYR